MKKTCLTFLTVLILSLHAIAQDSFSPSTHIGLHTGVNLCHTSFDPVISQDIFQSYDAGLIFRHISEPQIGLQLEVNYGLKGWIENRDSIGSYKRELETIDFPITSVFLFGKKQMKLSFYIGPYLTYLKQETEILNVADTTDYNDYYNIPMEQKWGFGLLAGLGAEWHHRIGILAIRGSYSYRMSNLFPLRSSVFYFEDSRMQTLNIGIVYMINL